MNSKLLYSVLFLVTFTSFSQVNLSGFYPSTDVSGLGFGLATALDQNNYVVSSNSFQNNQGKVFVFSLNNGTMIQQNVLFENDVLSTDKFGSSVSIEGDFIVVGSSKHNVNLDDQGAIYIYRFIDGNWTFFQKIIAFDASEEDQFGSCVKIYNNTLFVSAPFSNNENSTGAVYVYELNGANWEFENKLTVTGSIQLGEKIEVITDQMIVSDVTNEQNRVYHTFTLNESWSYSDSTSEFGNLELNIKDFSFDGERIYITANKFSTSSPLNDIYILNRINNNWELETTLSLNFNDFIIGKISVSANNMLVGFENYILQTARKYPVHYYKKTNADWVFQTLFYGEGTMAMDDDFGKSISLQGLNCIIGAPKEGFTANGKAYSFNLENLNTRTFDKKAMVLYPNPTSGELFFDNFSSVSIEGFEIYSTLGKIVQSGKLENPSLSLKTLQNGLYFIRIQFQDGTIQTVKVIKK
jgi:hypothetical protein